MLVNLTPHPVVFEGGGSLPKCENPPRLGEIVEKIGEVDGIPVYMKQMDKGSVKLPQQKEGTYYVVPLALASAFPERGDLLVPNEMVRDSEGRIVACRSLARVV